VFFCTAVEGEADVRCFPALNMTVQKESRGFAAHHDSWDAAREILQGESPFGLTPREDVQGRGAAMKRLSGALWPAGLA
jgi:hypothetical protein